MWELQSRMDFVLEGIAIEGFASTTGSRPVSSLDKEVGYYSVEYHTIVVSYEI